MKRLTKKISLVLISSSLTLYGCQPHMGQAERERLAAERNRRVAERKVREQQEALEGGASFEELPPEEVAAGSGTASTSHTGSHTHYRRGFVFIPWGIGGSRPSGGTMGVRSGSTTGTRSGAPSSVSSRGGFGGSAHASTSS